MPLTGTLRTWHDDRGFGFIAPTHGGREVFVHVSAFPNDGSRPTQGERLTYELAPGRDGKMQAVKVTRLSVGSRPAARPIATARPRSRLPRLLVIALLAAATALAYVRWRPPTPATAPDASPQVEAPRAADRSARQPLPLRRPPPLLADDLLRRGDVLPEKLPRR